MDTCNSFLTLIHFNKCLCGWWFPSLSKYSIKCPQCITEQRLCEQCGIPISGHHHKRYCNDCRKQRRKILDKYNRKSRKEKEKYKHSDRNNHDENICNYDCFNCKFSECLLPPDKDDHYDNETIKMF